MGVDLDEFAFRETMYIPSRIIYCGKLDYLPNTDAAVYFAKRIFPYVRRLVPNAQFIVAGFNPPRCLRTLAETPGIEVQANLPDVRPVISSAAVSVAPIRFGAGIQNKILQSLALGVPVVASPLAAGPFSQNGTSPVLVAASPEKFAGLVVRVLQDHEYRMHLARKGRELIETTYGWDQVFGSLDRIIERHMKVAAKLSRGNLFV
jgi:glycosyltransferase involved in cell wall biosynthesis